MSQQLICDDCGEPIDTSKQFYTLNGTKVQMVDGSLIVIEAAVQLDYHVEHLPQYKIQGEVVVPPDIDTPTPEPEEPVEEPETPEEPPEDEGRE